MPALSNPALKVAAGVTATLAISALLFSDKFTFLQNKTVSNDSTNKCPQKCCKSCNLNIPIVLLFAGGIGAATGILVEMAQKSRHNKLVVAPAK
jgi:hypothetical protein